MLLFYVSDFQRECHPPYVIFYATEFHNIYLYKVVILLCIPHQFIWHFHFQYILLLSKFWIMFRLMHFGIS